MPIPLKPTGNRVLVEPIAPIQTTRSGLLIPENSKDDPSEGIAVAVGPGRHGSPPMEVKLGDRVFFNRFEGQPIQINRKIYKMFEARELLAIIE